MSFHRRLFGSTEGLAPARPSWRLAFAIALTVLSGGGSAALGPAGSQFDTSDFTIDLHQGPITAGSRIIGLAGTIAPITEGVDGFAANPVSVAMRVPRSRSWVDGELDFGFTRPTSITRSDFDNNGDDGFSNNAASFVNAGACLQFGAWGIGLGVERGQSMASCCGREPTSSRPDSTSSLRLHATASLDLHSFNAARGALGGIGMVHMSCHGPLALPWPTCAQSTESAEDGRRAI